MYYIRKLYDVQRNNLQKNLKIQAASQWVFLWYNFFCKWIVLFEKLSLCFWKYTLYSLLHSTYKSIKLVLSFVRLRDLINVACVAQCEKYTPRCFSQIDPQVILRESLVRSRLLTKAFWISWGRLPLNARLRILCASMRLCAVICMIY